MDQHQVKALYQGGMHFLADAPGGQVKLDAAEDVGGKGLGNRSKPLMLVALAGCTGMDVASLLQKMRVDVEDFWIEVTGDLTEEHPKTYHSTHVVYTFKGTNIDQAKIEKIIDLTFDKYCGVIAMFKSFSKVTKEIRYTA